MKTGTSHHSQLNKRASLRAISLSTARKKYAAREHFGVPLKSQQQYLFNNAALAVQVPHGQEEEAIAATTRSTAQPNGWIWDIGLQHRRGVGHVFSTEYQSIADTEQLLDQYLRSTGRPTGLDELSPRLLNFEPGYREVFWIKNCIGIGLSAGFIEPLEASASF